MTALAKPTRISMNEGFKSKIRLVRLFRLRTALSGLTCYMLGAERAANEGDACTEYWKSAVRVVFV